ncbi:hypothetical protein B0H14DRAFT_1131123 [Mycena olivaceomarginata]|nr:hypothetical protein B0H14DRAFT_1131123 [Mycena olivaceomarginata]
MNERTTEPSILFLDSTSSSAPPPLFFPLSLSYRYRLLVSKPNPIQNQRIKSTLTFRFPLPLFASILFLFLLLSDIYARCSSQSTTQSIFLSVLFSHSHLPALYQPNYYPLPFLLLLPRFLSFFSRTASYCITTTTTGLGLPFLLSFSKIHP